MKETIINSIKQIEFLHEIKILYVCEAGSRAWGIASEESDYDIRFIYIHPAEHYLSIDPVGIGRKHDVIEKKIDEKLDITGWELSKTLRLYRNSNPSLLEWLHSSIIYYQSFSTIDKMRKMHASVFVPKTCILHYMNMAKANFKKIRAGHHVHVKNYINVIRPILATRWISVYQTFPPVDLYFLVKCLLPEGELKDSIMKMIDEKSAGKEYAEHVEAAAIQLFIQKEIDKTFTSEKIIPPKITDPTEELNKLFRMTLKEVWELYDFE
ncbi:nucleotidyltransferase domain-containing protein [Ornithinibacillus salinisoli]|uniref:Nucleotidyltransferase domain-containing protein n=1 Tax=Ornithinibacillus salinisoli TaxID=1848459 RepID=A0ABW4W0S9_9BACI